MSKHFTRTDLTEATAPAAIVSAPGAVLLRTGHVFDLPPVLHIATFGSFAAFLALMWAVFGEKELLISFAIFAIFIVAFFTVPALWARIDTRSGRMAGWDDFVRDGFDCMTGHLSARETMVQVLIMPAMLLLWGLSIAVVRALI